MGDLMINSLPLISIVTPTHDPKWLDDCYDSLRAQTYSNWEWVVVPNNGARVSVALDSRIRVLPAPEEAGQRIGALKKFGFENARGDIFVELDHDDLLVERCLEKLKSKFDSDSRITMVHSNDCHVDMQFKTTEIWSPYYGWQYRPFEWHGHKMLENIAPEAIPQHISRIWFAPDHVRSWRAESYKSIGPHDATMRISDDHDVVARHYLYGKIAHIDEPLYIYRVHENRTTFNLNREIQETMWENYNRYLFKFMEKWSNNSGLMQIDLGGGINPYPGFLTADKYNKADFDCDLDEDWPWDTGSVGVFRANDLVEHLKDPIHTMNEAYRCLAHGGFFIVDVPSTDGRGAWCDPTHVSYWNQVSFDYYTKESTQKFIAHKAKCKYQSMRTHTYFPNEWAKQNNIPYVSAHLIAVKGPRFHGPYDWSL
jgi:O-antigen biosynthesis protein